MSDRSKRWLVRAAVALGVVALIVAVPFAWYGLFLQPGAAVVKTLFEAGEAVVAGPGVPIDGEHVSVERAILVEVDGAPDASIDVYRPEDPAVDPRPMILWIHGGGFISNSSEMVAGYANVLADAGYVVASLEYSLAPGERHPTPVRQANAALAFLRSDAQRFGGDAAAVFVGGDSAGAQIASEVAAAETSPELAAAVGVEAALEPGALRCAVLFCGLYDMSTVASTGFPALRTFLWSYTGQRDWESFADLDQLSTTATATPDFPPTFLAVGDADPFEPQAHELQAALERQGVPVTTEFWDAAAPGLGHEYQFDFRLPEARTTLEDTLAFLADLADRSDLSDLEEPTR